MWTHASPDTKCFWNVPRNDKAGALNEDRRPVQQWVARHKIGVFTFLVPKHAAKMFCIFRSL